MKSLGMEINFYSLIRCFKAKYKIFKRILLNLNDINIYVSNKKLLKLKECIIISFLLKRFTKLMHIFRSRRERNWETDTAPTTGIFVKYPMSL